LQTGPLDVQTRQKIVLSRQKNEDAELSNTLQLQPYHFVCCSSSRRASLCYSCLYCFI